MDFFASQARAATRTRFMIAMFLAAVACIALSFNVIGALLYLSLADAHAAVPHGVYWATTSVVVAVIAIGSMRRMSQLWSGGAAVAEMLGARRMQPHPVGPDEQRLANIIEEMAIAAGIVVPAVYLLDDINTINAFAAGYSPNEAAIAVTKGTLRRLNRDELQGVVAHEFSHILNGDMRLNIQLVGVVAGIVAIGNCGRFLMRLGMGRSDDGRRNKGDIRVLGLGAAIWLIGSIGVLFGNLIRAAISRQREYHADAAAVQFTRNPDGIAGALFRISQLGSNMGQPHAEEVSHMCIGPTSFTEMFATHPPVEARIDRLLGPAGAVMIKRRVGTLTPDVPARDIAMPAAALQPDAAPAIDADGAMAFMALASVGQPTQAHVAYAHTLLDALPTELRRALGTVAGARAALFALALGDGDVRARQLDIIAQDTHRMMADQAANLAALMQPFGARVRMPVYRLAIAPLRMLDATERPATLATLRRLVLADGKVSLSEFVLVTLCNAHLASPSPGRHGRRSVGDAPHAAAAVLSMLAPSQADAVYAKAAASLGIASTPRIRRDQFTLTKVEIALNTLKALAPQEKAKLVAACMQIVLADGKVVNGEAELMYAVCAALDVPLPPLIEKAAGNRPATEAP